MSESTMVKLGLIVLGFVYLAIERDLQWWAASALMFAVAINLIKDNMCNDR